MILAKALQEAAEACPLPRALPVTASVSRTDRMGGVFTALENTAPLVAQSTGDVVFYELAVNKRGYTLTTTEDMWSDCRTTGNVTKTVRVLKSYVLKQTSNVTCRFLDASSKTLSMVFALRKFPSSLKALQILLPHASSQTTDGLFLKTAKGKKVLSVQFGRGDMDVEELVSNAMAVLLTVGKSLDPQLVRDITVDVDRLSLPVWNRRLSERGKPKRAFKSMGRNQGRMDTMGPPIGPPLKRVRVD